MVGKRTAPVGASSGEEKKDPTKSSSDTDSEKGGGGGGGGGSHLAPLKPNRMVIYVQINLLFLFYYCLANQCKI